MPVSWQEEEMLKDNIWGRGTQAVTRPVTPPPTIKILGEDGTGVRRGVGKGVRSLQDRRPSFIGADISDVQGGMLLGLFVLLKRGVFLREKAWEVYRGWTDDSTLNDILERTKADRFIGPFIEPVLDPDHIITLKPTMIHFRPPRIFASLTGPSLM
jgi:hypothetical protein